MTQCRHKYINQKCIWESKSQIEGALGEELPMMRSTPLFQPQSYPLAFITVKTCYNCSKSLLRAFESYFLHDKIRFDLISERALVDGIVTGDRRGTWTEQALPHFPIRRGRRSSNLPNIKDFPLETQQFIEELIQEIFSVENFLSEAQAKVITKIKLGKKLRSSTERNTKRQLRKKIRKAEYIKDFWDDLEELL